MRPWFYVCCVALMVASLSACDVLFERAPEGGSAGGGFCGMVAPEPQSAAEWMNIRLPADIAGFQMRCSGFMDHLSLDMQFTITPDQLADLQAGIPQIDTWQVNPPVTDEIVNSLSRLLSRQQIASIGSALYGVDAFRNYVMLIDTSDPQVYRVYLSTFQSF